ncbi:MAG: hypothetical protein HZC22_04190 [Rhodocyclales bacterium]|nr:hypothetical protein [Rhodocyclales bacterium]
MPLSKTENPASERTPLAIARGYAPLARANASPEAGWRRHTLAAGVPLNSEPLGLKVAMHTYRYAVSLRIWHPSENPSGFSAALGLEPRCIDVAGQPRVRKGKVLEFVPKESYWTHEFDIDIEQDIEDYLLLKANALACHKDFFANICGTGGRAEFFIGLYVEAPNCGVVLSPKLQQKCAALNLSLAFDIYGLLPSQPGEA